MREILIGLMKYYKFVRPRLMVCVCILLVVSFLSNRLTSREFDPGCDVTVAAAQRPTSLDL